MIALSVHGGKVSLGLPQLSAEQAAALLDDREVAVTAGAGAGKTTTLSARFVALHHRWMDDEDHEADPMAVLVLTFTEKAAAEMRERCYRMASEVANALAVEGARLVRDGLPERRLRRLRARWEALRDRFGAASISTFHGFCARVLGEFPAETVTPPGFGILEGARESALAGAAVAGAVHALLAGGASTARDASILLRALGGRARLVASLERLLRVRGEVDDRLAAYAAGRVTAEELAARCGVSSADAAAFLRYRWLPHADRLLTLSEGIHTPYLDGVAEIRRGLGAAEGDPLVLGELYGRALAVHCTKAGGIRKLNHASSIGKADLWGKRKGPARDAVLAELQAEADTWADLLETADQAASRFDRTMVEVLGALGRAHAEAGRRYRAALLAEGALDFSELLLRVRGALARPEGDVIGALRARHRFLMVDEFQDTDGLQWEIVRALARPEGGRRDRLFFVGDAKQAIYGFRGGDVQVFNGARRSVRGDEAGAPPGVELTLTINRRSRPELIDMFNGLFARVLGPPSPSRPDWEAPFEALAAGRPASGGTVRFLSYPAGSVEDGASAEAEAVVASIEAMLAADGPYAEERLGDRAHHPKPPIAILLRARTRMSVWESALRGRSIPYVVMGGVGFWARPEVVDLVNLLRALTRGDDVARVGALRSPLFGLDDDDLLALAAAGALGVWGLTPLPDALRARPAVARADLLWRRIDQESRWRSVAGLLRFVLTETRQFWSQAWLHPDGRALANVEQLLVLADTHDREGGGLEAFADRVGTQVDDAVRESEATLPEGEARVVIGTLHGSKGLEYPVVILPELGRVATGGPPEPIRVERMGGAWELSCVVPDEQGAADAVGVPGFHATLAAHARRLEDAESLRLFYVGCTRARDHLVLVGEVPEKAPSRPCWAWMVAGWVQGLDAAPPWLVVEPLVEGAAPPRRIPEPRLAPPVPDGLDRWVAPVEVPVRLEIAPGSLGSFVEDPDAWRLRHLEGVERGAAPRPSSGGGATRGEVAGASSTPTSSLRLASLAGRVIHGMLEDDALDDLPRGRARWLAGGRLDALDDGVLEAEWPRVAEQLARLRASAEVAALFDRRNYRELGVRLERPPVVLAGRLDLLCRDPLDGAWMVVDYKSQRDTEDDDALRAAFREQLLAYSVAASAVLEPRCGQGVVRAAVLLTRTARLVRFPDWTPDDVASFEGLLSRIASQVAEWAAVRMPDGRGGAPA